MPELEQAWSREEILGCPVDALSLEETVGYVRRSVQLHAGAIQVSINALKIGLAHDDEEFRRLLGSFDIANADGQPVVWASRLLARPLPGRVNGTDLMFALLAVAAHDGLRVYILGAKDHVLKAAVSRLRSKYPRLQIAGSEHGFYRPEEEAQVVGRVARTRPDILFVALPSPRKERFLAKYRDTLGAGFAMGVGGSIEVLAGHPPRAPKWMQRCGLEWFFRLLRDPRGMWRRYLSTNAQFVGLLAKELVRPRLRRGTKLF